MSRHTTEDPANGDISIADSAEIDRWCVLLGCTAAELGNAIGVVGYSVARVREYLAAGKGEPGAGRVS
jgi:hypothetical protein